jgi:hypothetical protein
MISKKARRLLFIETTIILILIYLAIIGITAILDTYRIQELDNQIQTQNIAHESFIASKKFYDSLGITDCEFSKKHIFEEFEEIKDLSINIASFKNRILKMNEKQHELKKREYIIAQAENYNKVNIHNTICKNKIHPILFFIDGDDIGFNQQALILQQFSLENQDEIIIYTLDINFREEPIIRYLMELNEVERHNTIIFGELNNTQGGNIGFGRLNSELEQMRQKI